MRKGKPVEKSKYTTVPIQDRPVLKILNAFAVELIRISDEIELAWYVARHVVGKMGFDDCVIYYLDPQRSVLRQVAAIGEKNPREFEILNLLEIPVGQGITGQVVKTKKPIVSGNLKTDKRYIADQIEANSEICVPMLSEEAVLGVIDCEDRRCQHFDDSHLEILSFVSSLMTAKLGHIRRDKALRLSERRHRVIFNRSLDGIISIDADGDIVECNPAAQDMFAISFQEIQGKSLSDFIILSEDQEPKGDGFQQFIKAHIQNPRNNRIEILGKRFSGEEFPIEITLSPYVMDGQQFLTGFIRDITDVKNAAMAEEAGRMVETRFKAFLEHLPSAFLIKDLDGNFLHANSIWHEWFNPKKEDVAGKRVEDYFPAELSSGEEKRDRLVVEQKKSFSTEVQTPLNDGRRITSLYQKFPILDASDSVVAIGGVITDISVRKKIEEQLRIALLKAEESNQSKSVFLATMSHELRTPLNAIIGFSDMLCGEYYGSMGDARYLDYAKNIQMSGKHLLALIGDVLDISSIELGIKEINPKSLSLPLILNDCINSLKLNAIRGKINLSLEINSHLPDIDADERAMKQIFLNLLTNSLKFSKAGDIIKTTARLEKSEIIVQVVDTGIGIEESYLPELTEPFVRGHDDSLTSHEGVGLGLSIVKSLVDAHNGRLEIKSKSGAGTTVTVVFPLTAPETILQ